MLSTNATLAISGGICMFLCGWLLYATLPRAGRPESAWTRTENRAVGVAMLVLILAFAGITMFAKGMFP
jgi:hypothetical protein